MLAIIDYQAGNQTSVRRALDHLGIASVVTDDPKILESAEGLIFPGVGAAGPAMSLLRERGLDKLMIKLVTAGRPFLGICLGCQIMLQTSDENSAVTLGLIPGRNIRFDKKLTDSSERPIRIPHMGWNTVELAKPTALWDGLHPDDQFYFVHSYYPIPEHAFAMGFTWHGLKFASVFGREGLWALQFHPEKSGPPGLRILRNFHDFCRGAANA